MFRRLAQWVLLYRRAIVITTIAVALGSAATVPWLEFNFTPQQLFKSTARLDQVREEFAATFGREDNLMTLLVFAPDVYDPAVLTYVHQLTLATRALPDAKRTDSLTTIELPRAQGRALSTRPLLRDHLEAKGQAFDDPKATVDAEIASKIRAWAVTEPLLQSRIVSKDAELTAVLLWLKDSMQEAQDLERFHNAVQAVLAARPPPPGVRIEFGGIPMVRVDVVQSLRVEQMTFVPLAGFVFFLLLIWLFRSVSGTVLPLATVLVAAGMIVALMVATGYPINIINNTLPMLIVVVGIADSVHMLTRQAEELEQGVDEEEATLRMIERTGAACLLTSTTTAVGFASLIVADSDILKAFGWQAAAGVMFAYLVTLFFLPAGLSYLKPVRRHKSSEIESLNPLDPQTLKRAPLLERSIVRLGQTVLTWPKSFIVFGLSITLGFVYFGTKVEIDTTLLEIYNNDHPTWRTTQTLEKKLGGILPVEISITHKDPDHFKNPEPFGKLAAYQRFAAGYDDVLSTQSMVDFHQAARAALLGDPAQRETLPTSRAQIEQIGLLIEGPPDSHGGVRSFLTSNGSQARILLRVSDSGAKSMIAMGADFDAKLEEMFPPSQGYKTYLTGDAYVASLALDSFIRDLFDSLLLAIVIIFAMMTVVFRSLKFGMISVLPNITPLVLTFGYMGYAGINLNTTTIIIFAISLGLAVDDTIHFLARFREELERQDSVHDALIHTYFGAGRAIMLTSVMLTIGMGVLMTSSFKPTFFFGKLTAITIGGAVFGDLILLPPILLLMYRGSKDDPKDT